MFFRRQNRKRRSLGDRLRDWYERLKAFVGRVGPYLILAVVAVSVPYLVLLGYRHVVSSPYFQVSDIDVRGAHHADVEELAGRANLVHGINIFDVEPASAKTVFEQSPWVRRASVDRRLPDRVVVSLKEYRPAAMLVDGGYGVVAASGRLIKRVEGTPGSALLDLPMLTGIAIDSTDQQRGRRLVAEAIRVAERYRQMGLAEGHPLSEVHVDPVVGLTLIEQTSGTEIRLGRGRYRQRLERLELLRRSLAERGIEPAYILLDQEESLDRVTVGRRSDQGRSGGQQK